MTAEYLGIPHATVISKFTFSPEKVVVERETEGGTREVLQLAVPCVIAANKGLNMPRYASLPGIMKAKKKTIKEVDGNAWIAPDSVKVSTKDWTLPPDKASVKLITGEPQQQAEQLVHLLRDEAKVL
jgi:electron transfer flavoprotein beta subunit